MSVYWALEELGETLLPLWGVHADLWGATIEGQGSWSRERGDHRRERVVMYLTITNEEWGSLATVLLLPVRDGLAVVLLGEPGTFGREDESAPPDPRPAALLGLPCLPKMQDIEMRSWYLGV